METLAWPSHSCTLAMSASFESAFVAAVARIECTQNADHFGADARLASVLHDDVAVDGAGIEVPVERAGAVVRHGPEEGSVQALMLTAPAVFPHFADIPRSAAAPSGEREQTGSCRACP